MTGNEIGEEVLLEPQPAVCFRIIPLELCIDSRGAFAHSSKYPGRYMFRRNFKLTAYMVTAKGFKEGASIMGIHLQIIKPDP